jgi:hypothetical protein
MKMPKVRWDFEDFEDFEDEEDFTKFEKIKGSQKRAMGEEERQITPKKRSSVKHQHRPDKE